MSEMPGQVMSDGEGCFTLMWLLLCTFLCVFLMAFVIYGAH